MDDGGRQLAPTVLAEETPSASPRTRALAAALTFELLWLLLLTASVVFFAAPLVPVAILVGLALVGARQAVERAAVPNGRPLTKMLRVALWTAAIANGAVVLSILTSLYHAHTTWIAVGVLLVAALSSVGWACARTARSR